MFEFKTLMLSSGHPIITPTGNPITDKEFHEYFRIVCDWLKETHPGRFEKIRPSANNQKTYGSMLSKMLDAFGYEEIVMERYFLDERTLAFIFVVSYYIQKENRTNTTPFLNHVLGNTLLNWLPIPELVEHHLALSARSGDIRDGITLAEVFGSGVRYRRWGFPHDKSKALKYATMAYESPFKKKSGEVFHTDLVYATTLFETNKKYAKKSMEIVLEKLKSIESVEDERSLCVNVSFLALGLEISSKVRLPMNLRIDTALAERCVQCRNLSWPAESECAYWLAMCFIVGKNNPKNVAKAVKLLTTHIKNPDFGKLAAVALAQIYLDGNGVEKDPWQAYSIARFAEVQRGSLKLHKDKGDAALKRILRMASEQVNGK